MAALALLPSAALAQSTWTTRAAMPRPRIDHVAAGSHLAGGAGRVFVFAGDDGSSVHSAVDAFDPSAAGGIGAWDPPGTYPAIPTTRSLPAVATDAAGKIYVIGGFSGGSITHAVVQVFDPTAAAPNWTTISPLSTPRCGAAATFGSDGKLYVFGGRDASGATVYSSVERYDPANPGAGWSAVASLPAAHWQIGAAAGCDDKIWVIGARSSAQTCPSGSGSAAYCYDISQNQWTAVTGPPACLGGRGVVQGPDDRIYLINDGNYNNFDPTVYSLDPSVPGGSWRAEPNTNYGYTYLAAARLDDRIYALGGSYRFPSDPTRFESLTTGTASVCGPPPSCVNLQASFTGERFAALPTDRLQLVAYYDGNGTADLDIHLTNPSTLACCVLTVSGIANTPFTIQEYAMNGFVPTGKFVVRNVVPNGAIDGVAFGLYWRDAAGARWRLQSRAPGTATSTPNFVGGWPYTWTEATWDSLMPQLAGPTFDDTVKRRQAQMHLSGAQVLGNGTWGIQTGRVPADTNADGCVDLQDLAVLLGTFGFCCP